MASSGFSAKQIILLVAVAASLLAVTQAATVVVGGSENWRYGYNYTEWAANIAPFYFEDTLGSYQPNHIKLMNTLFFPFLAPFSLLLMFIYHCCINLQCSNMRIPQLIAFTCCQTCGVT